MVTLQQAFEQCFNDKNLTGEMTEICDELEKYCSSQYCPFNQEESLIIEGFTNIKAIRNTHFRSNSILKIFSLKLIIRNCPKLEIVTFSCQAVYNGIINSFVLNNCPNVKEMEIEGQNLTTVNFLSELNPINLTYLALPNNNIQPTTLEIFSRFQNLKDLCIQTNYYQKINQGIYNRFYGSLRPLQPLIKLETLWIELTDVEEGLEYLPDSLQKISVSSINLNTKVAKIREQLKPYNYNVKSWKLDNKDKVKISELEAQIQKVKTELEQVRLNESDKTKKIEQLENQIKLLQEFRDNLLRDKERFINELNEIKKQKEDLEKLLQESTTSSATSRQEIDELKTQLIQSQTQNTLLQTEKIQLQNSLQEQEQQNQLAINQIKKDYEKHLTKLNEEVEDLTNELLEIKRIQLEKMVEEIKSKLDEKLWTYLDILLLVPDKSEINEKTQAALTKHLNTNDLQKLILLQHQINHLEKRSNELTQIEVLPPTYTRN